MEERLVKAAREGNVDTLVNLLEEDPQLLDKACLDHFADSPLHVAALSGKADFVKKVVSPRPSLAIETNQKGMIPLHLASLEGHIETVKELLKAKTDDDIGVTNNHQCLVKDEEGWTPLHCASQKGKIRVIEELIRECPECLKEVTEKGETVLHISVKANQFEAVKVLADSIKHHNFPTLFKALDQKGKSAYQLAAAKKQLQVQEALKEQYEVEIREEHGIDVEGDEGSDNNNNNNNNNNDNNNEATSRKDESCRGWQSQQNAILVVAALTTTLTYQAMANPPSTFVQKGGKMITWSGCTLSVLAFLFMIFNSCIFLQSIYVMVTTLRCPRVFSVRVLTLFLVLCYAILLANFCYNAIYTGLSYAVLGVALLASCILARQNFFIGCMRRCLRQHPERS